MNSEAEFQPFFASQLCFDRGNVLESILVIPSSAIPPAYTAPQVPCMIARITNCRSAIIKIRDPSLVTRANNTIHILGIEGSVIAAHWPCTLIIHIFYLENAVALIAAFPVPCTWWAEARTRIGCPIAYLVLVPMRFYYGLSADNICTDSPLTCDPLEDFICCSSEVARDLLTESVRFRVKSNTRSPWFHTSYLLSSWNLMICGSVIRTWLP